MKIKYRLNGKNNDMKQRDTYCHSEMNRIVLVGILLLTFLPVKGGCQVSGAVRLLLADSTAPAPSELNLQLVAQFYGLNFDIRSIHSVDSTALFDGSGRAYRCLAINGFLLESLDTLSVNVLITYVNNGGNIFVQDVSKDSRQGAHQNLSRLTHGEVTGVQWQGQPHSDVVFSSVVPSITDVLSGLSFANIYPGNDQALLLSADTCVRPLMGHYNTAGGYFCFFSECPVGLGNIFVSSASNTVAWSYLNEGYNIRNGSSVIPAMMVLRYLYGDKAWHVSQKLANLTIDDPALANIQLNYPDLLTNMKQHRYHLTIAYIPLNFINKVDDPAVEKLFVSNPQYLSIIQHGDYHHTDNSLTDGYEFFVYTSSDSALACATENLSGFYPVPLARQEVKIVDGATKIYLMEKELGLPGNRLMVFPDGIAPSRTLSLLRKYNFHSAVDPQTVPLLACPDTSWDSWVRPSDLSYGSMPMLSRTHPYNRDSLQTGPFFSCAVLNLFIGVPALLYSHAYELFAHSSSAFNSFADSINALTDPPAWASLDSIATSLYLVKLNDDGSDSLRVFGNTVYIDLSAGTLVHVTKQENIDPNFIETIVNGTSVPFSYNNGFIHFDVSVQAGGKTKLEFCYQHSYVGFGIGDTAHSAKGDSLYVWIRNSGDSSGVCPAIIYDSTSMSLLSVVTQWIGAHDSTLFAFPVSYIHSDWLILDPGGIVQEQTGDKNILGLLPTRTDRSLPVQATDFVATTHMNSVTLTWTTQSEVDNAGFNILREDPGSSSFKLTANYATDKALVGLGTSSTGRNYSFTDNHVVAGSTYRYKIQGVSTDGTTEDLTTLSVTSNVPTKCALYQNYPNPFNPSTTVRFDLNVASTVALDIYDVLGQKVIEQNYGTMNAGSYNENIYMDRFASGVYYYRLDVLGNEGQKFTCVKKFVLLR